jgi:preprotein translocase subunit Sec63
MRDDPDFMIRISLDLAARKAARRILDVAEDADQEQIKRAYRIAAIHCHPDHAGNTAEANRMFTLIKCAYDLLALDQPCDALLVEMSSSPDVLQDDTYNLDNPWGHFCWWREKFFGTGGGV